MASESQFLIFDNIIFFRDTASVPRLRSRRAYIPLSAATSFGRLSLDTSRTMLPSLKPTISMTVTTHFYGQMSTNNANFARHASYQLLKEKAYGRAEDIIIEKADGADDANIDYLFIYFADAV